MARFHLDHNVSAGIADLLRGLGHDVVTAWDLGLGAADDDVHLLAAADDNRILVTFDGKDYLLLHKAWRRWSQAWGLPRGHAGILIVAPWPHMTPELAAREVDAIQSRVTLADQCYSYDWRNRQVWEHKPVS